MGLHRRDAFGLYWTRTACESCALAQRETAHTTDRPSFHTTQNTIARAREFRLHTRTRTLIGKNETRRLLLHTTHKLFLCGVKPSLHTIHQYHKHAKVKCTRGHEYSLGTTRYLQAIVAHHPQNTIPQACENKLMTQTRTLPRQQQ